MKHKGSFETPRFVDERSEAICIRLMLRACFLMGYFFRRLSSASIHAKAFLLSCRNDSISDGLSRFDVDEVTGV